jgi:hypothetical protein
MRNLQEDLKWLEKSKNARDLSDDYLRNTQNYFLGWHLLLNLPRQITELYFWATS